MACFVTMDKDGEEERQTAIIKERLTWQYGW